MILLELAASLNVALTPYSCSDKGHKHQPVATQPRTPRDKSPHRGTGRRE